MPSWSACLIQTTDRQQIPDAIQLEQKLVPGSFYLKLVARTSTRGCMCVTYTTDLDHYVLVSKARYAVSRMAKNSEMDSKIRSIVGAEMDSIKIIVPLQVSTLFEEEGGGVEGEAAEFQLEDASSVVLPGPLSYPMDSVASEVQDEEMAQSAHLMSLGLCRISNIKCLPGTRTPERRSGPAPEQGQEDLPLAEKPPRPARAGVRKPSGTQGPSCVLCHVRLESQTQLEVHLKCHAGEQGFRCPRCGWACEAWPKMERHWRTHGRRRGGRPHRCRLCARTFRSAEARDAHQRRHARRQGDPAQRARGSAWCPSQQESELHGRCHVQEGFKCLQCDFTGGGGTCPRAHVTRALGRDRFCRCIEFSTSVLSSRGTVSVPASHFSHSGPLNS